MIIYCCGVGCQRFIKFRPITAEVSVMGDTLRLMQAGQVAKELNWKLARHGVYCGLCQLTLNRKRKKHD